MALRGVYYLTGIKDDPVVMNCMIVMNIQVALVHNVPSSS